MERSRHPGGTTVTRDVGHDLLASFLADLPVHGRALMIRASGDRRWGVPRYGVNAMFPRPTRLAGRRR
jgi:hypothetical protein